MRIIALSGTKGGVGVTTVAAQLGATLALRGTETLVVELNRSGGCVDLMGMAPSSPVMTVTSQLARGMFVETRSLGDLPELRVVDARPDVDTFEKLPVEGAVRLAIEGLERRPEVVLLDVAPGLDPLAQWAIAEADEVIVVVQPSGLAVRTILNMVESAARSKTVFAGLLCNRYGVVGPTGEACLEELRQMFDAWILPIEIPSSEALQRAAVNGVSIFWEDGRSEAARAFKDLADLVTETDDDDISETMAIV